VVDVEERADLERAGRHDPAAGQQIARHRERRAGSVEMPVGAFPAVEPVGHGEREMFVEVLPDMGIVDQRRDASFLQQGGIADPRTL